jgi:hypothetical protein
LHGYIYCFARRMRARRILFGLYGMVRAAITACYNEGKACPVAQMVHELHEVCVYFALAAMLAG